MVVNEARSLGTRYRWLRRAIAISLLAAPVCAALGSARPVIAEGSTPTTTSTQTPDPCGGDCNGDGSIGIAEIVEMVGIVLGETPASACPGFDCTEGGCIPGLIRSVDHALLGCPNAAPMLSLALRLGESSGEQQVEVVATLRHLGGPVVSYLTGCTALCLPPMLEPIALELTGPGGREVTAECKPGGPYFCAEYLMPLAPGESLTHTLAITGAWEKEGFLENCGECRQTPLAPGPYIITARFRYRVGTDISDPVHELTQAVQFDWPPP